MDTRSIPDLQDLDIDETARSLGLSPEHLSMLYVESGIKIHIIKGRGYRTVVKKTDMRALGFPGSQQRVPSIVIPIYNVLGKLVCYQSRPDAPRMGTDGRIIKYETPYGSSVFVDIHPSMRCYIDDPRLPLVFTEGIKKGDAGASHDICFASLLGVWNFRGKNAKGGKTALPDFEYLALNGRQAYIAFDSDVMTNPQVYQALVRIKKLLELWKARVSLIYLPSGEGGVKQGVDDFLASGHGINDLFALATNEVKAPPKDKEDGPEYILTGKGTVREAQANYEIMLSEQSEWKGRLGYNTLSYQEELDGSPITNHDRNLISSWASHHLLFTGSRTSMRDAAINVISMKSPHDPLMEYINDLPEWDGVERIEKFFVDYFGAEDSKAIKWCGRAFFAQAIARALNPGCEGRYVMVLEGAQDKGKSQALRALGGEWYTSLGASIDSKEASMSLKGKWIIELEEMSAVRKADVEHVKSFISRPFDDYVPKYANDALRQLRRCIFVGSTNARDYLIDNTGNTRWFPIKTTFADHESVKKDRDMLLSEAVAWHRNNPKWWVIPDDVLVMIEEKRDARRPEGAYDSIISAWIEREKPEMLHSQLVIEGCLEMRQDSPAYRTACLEVAKSLKALGWEKGERKARCPRMKTVVWPWYPPNKTAVSQESAVPSVPSQNGHGTKYM